MTLPNCYRCHKQPCACADGITIYHGDCREVLPSLSHIDAVVTDPPYLTNDCRVPILGSGVAKKIEDSESVGMPWGYSEGWIADCKGLKPNNWIVFCNYRMLAGICTLCPPSSVFVWRKSNAPRMTRPVPRLDCEFIVWSRSSGSCGRMGEFDSMVIDVPGLQAGCFATERLTERGTLKALHPCQKPIAVVSPFIDRLPCETVLDPFAGTGTTLLAAKLLGRQAIGIEIKERYCEIAARRLDQGVLFGATP